MALNTRHMLRQEYIKNMCLVIYLNDNKNLKVNT